jgi:sodium-coupled neutral amino acid transporter 11
MPKDDKVTARLTERSDASEDETRSLLSGSSNDDDDDLVVHPGRTDQHDFNPNPPPLRSNAIRQSSISRPPPSGQRRTPRTPNRVRFDLDDELDEEAEEPRLANGHARSGEDVSWMEEDDYLSDNSSRHRSSTGQMAPLLTDIEAPSVTLATSDDVFPEDHLEGARPRSGMRMAFMNMANSIIGAGIIGQPYALRQAGMVMGIVLLVVLTVTVDWTIRLIVVNSKMSGADSFQSTMQHCFGKSGLIAISVAQWAFAFGGMIAFCIIVGDTIPHVFQALFPSLREMPFLWLLTDRRAVIIIFTLCISYPLSLYRDIAKVTETDKSSWTWANDPSWQKLPP